MKSNILIILVLIVISACTFTVPLHTRKNFTYCFNNSYTGLDTLIQIDGYYNSINCLFDSTISLENTYYFTSRYVFFNNGLVKVNPYYMYFKDTAYYDRWSDIFGDHGLYKIVGDTIKVQYIGAPGGQSRGAATIWFLILSKTRLEIIYRGDPFVSYPLQKSQSYRDVYLFRPNINQLSKTKSSLLKYKWFWCDKQKRKAYRDSIR